MTDRPFRVALIQESPVFLNLAATVERAVERIAEAAAEGAAVVVFPETWLPGYPVWIDSAPAAALWDHRPAKVLYRLLRANSPEIPGPEFDALRRAAGKAGVTVLIGLHEKRGGSLYNTILMLGSDGERWKLHRKLVPTYTERLLWGQGDGSTLEAIRTEHGTIGALVCWEHWMPLARAVMHAQGEVLHVAQWPWVRDLHLLCSRQYAFEGQCFVAASGCSMTRGQMLDGFDSLGSGEQGARDLLESIPGDADTPMLRGGSALIAPDTGFVAGPELDSSAMVLGEVDPDLVEEGRMYLDTDGHYSRPDVFLLQVDTDPRANVMVPDAHHDHDPDDYDHDEHDGDHSCGCGHDHDH